MAELLSCPFCGGEAAMDDIGSLRPVYSVGCSNNACPIECYNSGTDGYEPLIAAWNRRTHPDTSGDRMREALEPFAAACTISTYEDSDHIDDTLAAAKITWGDLRRALAALRPPQTEIAD